MILGLYRICGLLDTIQGFSFIQQVFVEVRSDNRAMTYDIPAATCLWPALMVKVLLLLLCLEPFAMPSKAHD